MSLYFINVTIHVFAALLWLGGMFFLAAVGAPVLRRVEPPALRAELFRFMLALLLLAVGLRFALELMVRPSEPFSISVQESRG